MIEGVDVASAKAARVSDEVAKLEGHFVHEAEGAAARGLGELNSVRLELGERVGGQALSAEFGLDGLDEVGAKWAEIRASNTCSEDGEQRAGVREQETLLPVDPEQVQIPVAVGRGEFAERERTAAEQIEHLLRAAHDHAANLAPAVGSSGCRFVLVDQPAEKIAAAHA